MRDRERDNDHEGKWARELDTPQNASVERQTQQAEARLRDEHGNLAEVRNAWADFDRANPLAGDPLHRDFVRSQNLAFARVVDDMLRSETGEGLRERHAADVNDGTFGGLDARSPAREAAPSREEPTPKVPAVPERSTPPQQPDRELPPAPAPVRLSDAERNLVRAEANERLARPTPPMDRPSDVRPEAWYFERAQALAAPARASVERDVMRLKDLPQLATREAAAEALVRTATDFERDRAAGIDNEKLRTRLYALALVHELRSAEERERASSPERTSDRPPVERTAPGRPLPAASLDREVTPGSAPRVERFVVDATDPRVREEDKTIPEASFSRSSAAEVFASRQPQQQRDDSTSAGRKNVRALAQLDRERENEVSTRDIVVAEREEPSTSDVRDPTLNTRLSDRFRERSADLQRELAGVAAAADREYFALTNDARHDVAAASYVREVAAVIARIRAVPQSHDPVELAAKVNELNERERADPDITDGRLRSERLAYGVLAREAYTRQSALLGRATKDHIDEIRELPDAERKAFLAEAAVLLRNPAFNDRFAMNREVLRDDPPGIARFAAVARTAPSITELEREAKWRDASFHDRVGRRVKDMLFTPERDDDLSRALAEARVRASMPDNMIEARMAHEEAIELAEAVRRLPIARSLDIETPQQAYRPLHN